MSMDEVMSMTIQELASGSRRLLMTCNIDGCKFVLVTNKEDHNSTRKKYPGQAVILPRQLMGWFSREPGDDDARNMQSTLMAMSVFDGASIVAQGGNDGKNQRPY